MTDSTPSLIVAVLDSNILVRLALGKTASVNRLWASVRAGKFRLLLSPQILNELERVLHYPRIAHKYGLTETRIADFINALRTVVYLTDDLYEVTRVQADVTDNVFLACALEGDADYVVSQDPHLRDVGTY